MTDSRGSVLVIAGSDSSGGAGLARDLQVLADCKVDALCAITAVTAQTNVRTGAIHHVPPHVVREQIAAAFASRSIGAVKIGMLGTESTVAAVAEELDRVAAPIVLDPVLVASSGGTLLDPQGREAMRQRLLPLAMLLTPNIPEAAVLLQEAPAGDIEAMIEHAQRLLGLGPQAVLLKGGHSGGAEAVDVLLRKDGESLLLAAPRVNAERRGTGCALASAIAASLACGARLDEACQYAKQYITVLLSSGASSVSSSNFFSSTRCFP